MSDLHLSAQLISAAPAAATAGGLAAAPDPASLAGAADAFAALLAGKVGTADLQSLAAQALGTEAAGAIPAPVQALPGEAPPVLDPLAATALPSVVTTTEKTAAAEDAPEADAEAVGALPEATTQLLAAMGLLPPPAAAAPQPATAPRTGEGKGPVPITQSGAAGPSIPPAAAGAGPRDAHPLDADMRVVPEAREQPGRETGPLSAAAAHARAAAAEQPFVAPLQDALPAGPQGLQHAVTNLAASNASLTTSTPAPSVHMTVPGPVGTPLWREEFAASVNMLATQRVSSAELRMQPAELGPVQVSIRIEAGEANITCAAQHADTRHAMESALPRLREMLESNGISVGSASVGPHGHQTNAGGGPGYGQTQGQAAGSRGSTAATLAGDLPATITGARASARSNQLVDVFA